MRRSPGTLTQRQRELLQRVVDHGYDLQALADHFHVSHHTIKAHKGDIYLTLGVNNMTDAVVEAIRLGLVNIHGTQDETDETVLEHVANRLENLAADLRKGVVPA